tara:strand:- start:42 stop:2012 length:1971 start_codon:yes stop_codon:yes gene_type:complete
MKDPILDKILTEWAYRVDDGMPNPENNYHLVVLGEAFDELRLPRKFKKRFLEKIRKYVDNKKNRELNRVGEPWGSEGDPSKDSSSVDDKVEMPDVDVDNISHGEAGEIVYPEIEKTAQRIEELLKKGKKKEAQVFAKTLIDKYKLTKPVYIQPEKERLGKIYVGDNYRYAWGSKNEGNVAQKKIIDMIEKSGTAIPARPGGISATALSPQQVHKKRKVGIIKSIKDKDGKIVSKEVRIGDRTFALEANPEDPLSQMKLETLPDGKVEFCDINSPDTPEGRTECIMNATSNMTEMFNTIEHHLADDDDFNRNIAKKVKDGMKELQRLENAKNEAKSDEEKEELQKEFFNKCLEIMAETKQTNPDGVNEYTKMTAFMAETVEAIVDLNRGIETYIPSSANFKTSDVLSLEGGDIKSTAVTLDGRSAAFTIKGTSVKFAGGGASQMPNKNDNSTYKDNDVEIMVGGENRKGTGQILSGLTDYYGKLFPDVDKTPEPIGEDELKKMYDDNLNALYEYYTEFKDNPHILEEAMDRSRNAAEKQLKRLNKKRMENSEGYDNALKRFELYHFNQWVAGMVYNHPERGMKTQAYANSDYVVGSKEGKKYVKRVHSDGIDSVVWHGWDPDQGYTISKNGKITPTNVYASRMKHTNPALYWMKKAK